MTTTQIIQKIQETVADSGTENLTDNVKLSDLIRLGAMQTKPTRGWGDCAEGTACALSAAAIAAESLGLLSE